MLNYIITRSAPAKIEFARTWKEAENLAEVLFNQSQSSCQIVVAEVLSIKTTSAQRRNNK